MSLLRALLFCPGRTGVGLALFFVDHSGAGCIGVKGNSAVVETMENDGDQNVSAEMFDLALPAI